MKSAVVSVIAIGALTTGLVLGTGQAQARGGKLDVVALGDSFGSGTGAGDYLDGTGVPNGCWRSANSYSENIVARLRSRGKRVSFTNVTCSGAATTDMSQEFKGEPPQLDALQPEIDLVFLSIGTSDIDFAGYGLVCVTGDCSGEAAEAEIAEMPGMGQNVATLLDKITARSPRAHIVMTGYGSMLTAGKNAPDVPLDAICDPGFISSQERIDGNRVLRTLDETLRQTARQGRATYVSPYLGNSETLHPKFDGHSLCQSDDPYYRGLEALDPGQEGIEAVLHLNKAGQSTLATLIKHKFIR